MFERQRGACALCGRVLDEARSTRRVVVDHDHATGAVRGLVHQQCNTALGVVDRIGLNAFEAYLKKVSQCHA